jgi:hypothetical protein
LAKIGSASKNSLSNSTLQFAASPARVVNSPIFIAPRLLIVFSKLIARVIDNPFWAAV